MEKAHRAIRFNQKAWLKPYIDMIIILINAAKKHFQKDFIKLVNNSVFGKTVENFQKHRSIKLMKIKKKECTWCQNKTIILQIFSQKLY